MAFPPHDRSARKEILRGVYEENRRITGPVELGASVRQGFRRPGAGASPWRKRLPALVAVVVLALGAFAVQGLAGGQEDERRATEAPTYLVDEASPAYGPLADSLARADMTLQAGMPIARLFDLRVQTIVIDPGHGGRDPGALGYGGTREKDVALDVALRLKRRLEAHYGYRILLTREGDEKVSLRERVAFANANQADLFISIHLNWLPQESVSAVETYYFGMDADEAALRAAERENRDSELSVGAFNEMLQKIGHTMKLQESKRLAVSIQRRLYRNMRQINRDVDDWGVKTAPFVVLLGVEAPSVLAEIACISNRAEEAKLASDAYREDVARFLEEGIADYLGAAAPPSEPTGGSTENATEED